MGDTIRHGGRKGKQPWRCRNTMDVIALTGTLRYREHRSVPELHRELSRRGVATLRCWIIEATAWT